MMKIHPGLSKIGQGWYLRGLGPSTEMLLVVNMLSWGGVIVR